MITRLIASLLLLTATSTAAVAEKVSVKESGDHIFTITGVFSVPVSSVVAWNVLTDYEHIHDFVNSVVTDSVQRRSNSQIVTYQTMSLGPFHRKSRIALNVTEDLQQQRIAFRDTLGTDFSGYQGQWQVTNNAGISTVNYTLALQLKWRIPGWSTRWIVGHFTKDILDKVEHEMLKRAQATVPAPEVKGKTKKNHSNSAGP